MAGAEGRGGAPRVEGDGGRRGRKGWGRPRWEGRAGRAARGWSEHRLTSYWKKKYKKVEGEEGV